MASNMLLRSTRRTGPNIKLDTLPPEVRTVIYAHLCDNLCLEVSKDGELSTINYPWRLSCVSRILRNEILPILRGTSQVHPLRLVCEGGRFPDSIRRRIPNHVLSGISIVTILDSINYDDLKPSLTTFPNLSELRLALMYVTAPRCWGSDYLAEQIGGRGRRTPPVPEDDAAQIIEHVKRDSEVMRITAQMKREQEQPREGLERDYLVEGTLYQVLNMDRRRRGFDVKMEAILIGYEDTEYFGHDFCGMIRIDDWDSGRGSHLKGSYTGPWRLYV